MAQQETTFGPAKRPRTWGHPHIPDDVSTVTDAAGRQWDRGTRQPSHWYGNLAPSGLSTGNLLQAYGPLTEVVETKAEEPKRIRALIIHPDGTSDVQYINSNLAALQQIVGGYIEDVGSAVPGWIGYCNENGKVEGLPYNPLATRLALTLLWNDGNHDRDVLVGTVVFLGFDEDEGAEIDLPEAVVWIFNNLVRGDS